MERTLSIIKPDAVERNLENKIKIFFETLGIYINPWVLAKRIKKYG